MKDQDIEALRRHKGTTLNRQGRRRDLYHVSDQENGGWEKV